MSLLVVVASCSATQCVSSNFVLLRGPMCWHPLHLSVKNMLHTMAWHAATYHQNGVAEVIDLRVSSATMDIFAVVNVHCCCGVFYCTCEHILYKTGALTQSIALAIQPFPRTSRSSIVPLIIESAQCTTIWIRPLLCFSTRRDYLEAPLELWDSRDAQVLQECWIAHVGV